MSSCKYFIRLTHQVYYYFDIVKYDWIDVCILRYKIGVLIDRYLLLKYGPCNFISVVNSRHFILGFVFSGALVSIFLMVPGSG